MSTEFDPDKDDPVEFIHKLQVELDDIKSERKELNRQIDYLQDALDYSEQENRDLRQVLNENDIDY